MDNNKRLTIDKVDYRLSRYYETKIYQKEQTQTEYQVKYRNKREIIGNY